MNKLGIECPYCNTVNDTRVTDKRDVDKMIRRRRECEICGNRFSTYEMRSDDLRKIKHAKVVSGNLPSTHSLIHTLRCIASGDIRMSKSVRDVCGFAADRLEELDERIAIMTENETTDANVIFPGGDGS